MNFEQWLAGKGFALADLNERQRTSLEADFNAEKQRATVPVAQPVAQPAPQPVAQPAAPGGGPGTPDTFEQKMRAIEAEDARRRFIDEATVRAMEGHIGNAEKLRQFRELCAAAKLDPKMDQRAYELAILRLDRLQAPLVLTPSAPQVSESVLEAAICLTQRLPNIEKHFGEQTLQLAHTQFRRGLSLQHLILLAAERNGNYRGSARDEVAMCKAAFRRDIDLGMTATVPSTINVPGVLSNVANKFLAQNFLFTEQAWREIARIKPANDFKQMTTYRLTGDNKFERVAPGGEIKHGTLSEMTYTNKVDTYGRMLGIDRRDIRNDDLGAFTSATAELGRGAGDSLNEVFWTEFLDDAAFFPTDESLNNYDAGDPDSVLSLAGLEGADNLFRQQTKPDGTPLGLMPAILLVPTGLRITAMTLMNSTMLTGGGNAATFVPNVNPWAGAMRVVSSVYLTQTALGGSSTAWYILADPNNVAVIEVAFLDGMETPTVETSEFDFDRLGLAMRAYCDFGVSKMEYRGGVKMAGA